MRILTAVLVLFAATLSVRADQPLLDNTVEFTGQIFFLDSKVPGLVIGVIRDGETAVYGFGEIAKGSGRAPDAGTRIGVGSITKTLTGLALAHLAADGTVGLTDPASKWNADLNGLPDHEGREIRLIDIVTHSGGLQRDLFPVENRDGGDTRTFPANLDSLPLLYAPGTGVLYSNVGFDVLALALEGAAQQPYTAYLRERVLDPLGMQNTGYGRPEGANTMTGYDWNGDEMKPPAPAPNRYGASRIYTTAEDMLRYLAWNLDRFGEEGREARLLSHAAWLKRDGLAPVYGMDESGHMDAIGLGWVVMMPEGDRPLILQKAGGADGVFSYLAFAPSRNVGVFIAINQFNFAAGMEMAHVVNELIATLAPR
ncbi:D-alanyl-D-alanine-carboxypeptidase/endopeptidase AmpH [Roseibium sp. Sym1]|uniref:D-alanyl-D-alanine- carboxypeptidase/endopeptidase AmpH n=1 Tax=Roseibium sp. Sym1 TaxID=3016006 RepID=UPI0022B3D24C|nr:D-alanyl-D-alanine-carboxypeptidase/endopeptidase AmpH [Roseibium sp. Sym1]